MIKSGFHQDIAQSMESYLDLTRLTLTVILIFSEGIDGQSSCIGYACPHLQSCMFSGMLKASQSILILQRHPHCR